MEIAVQHESESMLDRSVAIESLLKRGVFGMLMCIDSHDKDSKKLCLARNVIKNRLIAQANLPLFSR